MYANAMVICTTPDGYLSPPLPQTCFLGVKISAPFHTRPFHTCARLCGVLSSYCPAASLGARPTVRVTGTARCACTAIQTCSRLIARTTPELKRNHDSKLEQAQLGSVLLPQGQQQRGGGEAPRRAVRIKVGAHIRCRRPLPYLLCKLIYLHQCNRICNVHTSDVDGAQCRARD